MKYKKGDILISLIPYEKGKDEDGNEAVVKVVEILRAYKRPMSKGFSSWNKDQYSVRFLSENHSSTTNDEWLKDRGYFKTALWTVTEENPSGKGCFDFEDLGATLKKHYFKPIHRQLKQLKGE